MIRKISKQIFTFKLPRLHKNEFNINAIKLISGSALSSLIFIIALPFLSRLYSPEAFGGFQQFLSYSAILSCFATFAYHSAIPIPQKRIESIQLVWISLLLAGFVCLLLLISISTLSNSLIQRIGLAGIYQGLYFLPIIVFFACLVLILEHVLVREKKFSLLSGYRVVRALVTQIGALSFAIITSSYLGLLLSYLLGLMISSGIIFLLGRKLFKTRPTSIQSIKETMRKYKKFPLIDTPSILITTLANELPIIMLAYFHSEKSVGVYAIAFRLIKGPLSIFSSSFSEVYYQKCSEYYFKSRKDMLSLFKATTLKMALIGAGFLLIVLMLAGIISRLYLGEGWGDTALVMRIIVVWIVFECTYNPISTSFYVTNKIEILFYLNFIFLIVRGVVMYCYRATPISMLMSLSIVLACAYLVYLLAAYKIIKKASS